jgi:uncharacterized protein (TIGR00725 family)
MPQAAVIGPSDASEEICEAAERIGAMLSRLGVTVITGGRGGVMEAASRGARNAGGLTIGIVPTAEMTEANRWCSVVIPTGIGHARNVLMALAGDFLVAIGSSAGTLSEICFAWLHGKTIFTLKGYNVWSDQIGHTPLDTRQTCSFTECISFEDLEKAIVEKCDALSRFTTR